MEGSEGSPPQSLCMIRAAELFPKPPMEKEHSDLTVPFQELPGESVKYLGRTDDGVLALSNYRLFLLKDSTNSETSVPLGLIESVQLRDLFHLIINCKDASTVKCSFETAEQCGEWQRRIQLSIGVPETLESLFAFPFCSWTCDTHTSATTSNGSVAHNGVPSTTQPCGPAACDNANPYLPSMGLLHSDTSERLQRASSYEDDFMREVDRMRFDLKGSWRVSHANMDFKLCPSYPQKILVPFCIPDEMLHGVANFRGSRRLPAVVWRHQRSGAVIARSSQPEVGWLGWRSAKDEQLLKALADACAFDRGELQRRLTNHISSNHTGATTMQNTQTTSTQTTNTNPSSNSAPSSPDSTHEEVVLDEIRKVLIVDARSYTSAVTNRARGGGCECIEYYPSAEIEFMNLGNIHVIRKSFHALRQLCASPPDIPNWLGMLEKTMWLQHLSGLLAASMTVCHAIEKKGRPVLVHCSDGWDRTPQIVATAQLCLDPYYRTVEGFRVLVEREWLSYGHKFSDRCGHGPGSDELNERCPVFLQWLDLVHQIHKQFPCSFEFSMGYLIKLAQHSLSCLFGTFLCNTLKERIENSVFERTFSVWPFLSGPMYRNPLYIANKERVLWPAHNVRDLCLWTEVYLGSLGNKSSIEFSACNVEGANGTINPMAKTRSYGDLISAGLYQNGMSRRSSDPNMSVDANLMVSSESENNSIADMPPAEGNSTPDVMASLIHDTTRKLQDLTSDLNNHDTDEAFKSSSDQKSPYNFIEQSPQSELYPNLSNGSNRLFGNSQMTMKENGCEETTLPPPSLSTKAKDNPSETGSYENSFRGDLVENGDPTPYDQQYGECTVDGGAGITEPKTYHPNIDLMQSVDLSVTDSSNDSAICKSNGFIRSSTSALPLNGSYTENMWHGSVNTSTDTLVPIENRQQQQLQQSACLTKEVEQDEEELKALASNDFKPDCDTNNGGNLTNSLENGLVCSNGEKTSTKSASSCNILPKIHNTPTATPISLSRNGTMGKSLFSTVSPAVTLRHDIGQAEIVGNVKDQNLNYNSSMKSNQMEESIMILPEHQKLEISISGKCETVAGCDDNGGSIGGVYPTKMLPPFYPIGGQRRRRTSSSNSTKYDAFSVRQPQHQQFNTGRTSLPSVRSLPMTPPGLPERPQIAISCPDGLAHALSEQNIRLQQIVHEHKLREDVLLRELHDMRMALLKRTCPNCNNAATSNDEQVDEIFDTNDSDSLEFITHKYCCARCRATCRKHKDIRHSCRHHRHQHHHHRHHHSHCNDHCRRHRHNERIDDDDQDESDICDCGGSSPISACSGMDNVENSSICSWEAVEDRSGASSCTSSTIQPNNATSVLWVPDHAVSRCTSCQTEFWLGRRKHHCRSCGQIFCADCSEFWAPLPDIKLFSPVRLCGPCYHAVTTRMQENASIATANMNGLSQFAHNPLLQLQQTMSNSVTTNAVQSVVSAAACVTPTATATTTKA